jgi:hypothetical protein
MIGRLNTIIAIRAGEDVDTAELSFPNKKLP